MEIYLVFNSYLKYYALLSRNHPVGESTILSSRPSPSNVTSGQKERDYRSQQLILVGR